MNWTIVLSWIFEFFDSSLQKEIACQTCWSFIQVSSTFRTLPGGCGHSRQTLSTKTMSTSCDTYWWSKKSKHKEQSRSSASIFISQMLVIWVLFESILKLIMQFEFNSKYFFSSTGNFCMINLSLKTWTKNLDDGALLQVHCHLSYSGHRLGCSV